MHQSLIILFIYEWSSLYYIWFLTIWFYNSIFQLLSWQFQMPIFVGDIVLQLIFRNIYNTFGPLLYIHKASLYNGIAHDHFDSWWLWTCVQIPYGDRWMTFLLWELGYGFIGSLASWKILRKRWAHPCRNQSLLSANK